MALSDRPPFASEFYASLPRKQVAAACLFLDSDGRVLLVKPTYKDGWELPGGAVEAGESPYDAAAREVSEELGLDRLPAELLAVDYRLAVEGIRGDALRFVFAGGLLSSADTGRIRLALDEVSEWRFVSVEDLDEYLIPVAARRVRAALTKPGSYLEEGDPPRT